MIVVQLMELMIGREAEVLGENLPSATPTHDLPDLEPGPPLWEDSIGY
jgi:hypothetical protein